MVVHAYNPSTWKAETGGLQVRGSLSNLVRPFQNTINPGVVAHACNPSTWEAEIGGSQVESQPQLLSEAFCNLARPCFKIKKKSQAWWHMLVIPVLGRLRQEDRRFAANLSYLVRPSAT